MENSHCLPGTSHFAFSSRGQIGLCSLMRNYSLNCVGVGKKERLTKIKFLRNNYIWEAENWPGKELIIEFLGFVLWASLLSPWSPFPLLPFSSDRYPQISSVPQNLQMCVIKFVLLLYKFVNWMTGSAWEKFRGVGEVFFVIVHLGASHFLCASWASLKKSSTSRACLGVRRKRLGIYKALNIVW